MSQRTATVDLVADDTVRRFATAVLFAALIGVLAQVSIPLPGGVPFSVQHFGVFFAGLVCGPLWGGFALALYVLVGLAGLPVFSNFGAGLAYFAGPTGGFLVGFFLAAVVTGAVAHRSLEPRPLREVRPTWIAAAVFLALVPVYAVGVPWLARVNGAPLGATAAAMAPLAAVDLVKAAITVGLARGDRLLALVE
ncbi:MAG: biotin transporter BioY [Haloarculaceae archaeon]